MRFTTLAGPADAPGFSRTLRRALVLAFFAAAACSAAIVSLMKGAVNIPAADVFLSAFGKGTGVNAQVIWNIRLPRTLVGGLVGMNLAMAGAILQSVMKNPLADPHIIGISSGAGLAGVIILILFPHREYLVTPVAFLGAM